MTTTRFYLLMFLLLACLIHGHAQGSLDGYVFEQNNRGFLQQAKVTVYAFPDNIVRSELMSDTFGHFNVALAPGLYRIVALKDVFYERQDTLEIKPGKNYLKMEMHRKPGYLFDVTLAEPRDNSDQIVDAVEGATIEVYNRTKHLPELTLKQHKTGFFQHTFEQGNHYTMLIRKPNYLAKRIEIYVNIRGCILCVDGVKTLSPGITDNLTAKNTMGTLVANIELERVRLNKKITLDKIYYDYDKYDIRADAAEELDKVVVLMKDNPGLSVELGSHTDSRGNDAYNLELSQKRAAAAVGYIVLEGVDSTRITAMGYGESQPVNRCRNGVVCSEAEHQKNRRTELRITGISGDSLEYLRWPTLEQIIQKEESEKAGAPAPQHHQPDLPEANNSVKLPPPSTVSRPPSTVHRPPSEEILLVIRPLPDDYSGPAIEIAQSEEELGVDAPAFKNLKDVCVQQVKGGKWFYYVCDTGGKTATTNLFQSKIRPHNRRARMVNFGRTGKTYLN
jgi:outer membrane protein OmpA-like peptidoglycan-associated protein